MTLLPAVLDPENLFTSPAAGWGDALPISDDFESGAIRAVSTQGPAKTAINAGLDMVMYGDYESVALSAYTTLLADAHDGALSRIGCRRPPTVCSSSRASRLGIGSS